MLDLENVHNFRDFGGCPAEDGFRVARGRLFRSAHLGRATDRDLETLRELGVAVVADLRRINERQMEPNRIPDGCDWRLITSDKGACELAPHLQFLRDLDVVTVEAVRKYMLSAYEGLPYEERHVELFSAVFEALADGRGPLLVHCAAGKDRTGVLCALILDALGVSHADVMADYEATNCAINLEGVAAQTSARIAKRLGRMISAEELRPFAGVSRDYLEAAWASITERSGSLQRYRREVLGLTPAKEVAMRAALIEPVAELDGWRMPTAPAAVVS